jgi:hypothetical protein
MTIAEQDALLYWITKAMEPAKSYEEQTSYGLKHNFEHEAFYITNEQFKGAMLSLGYAPKDDNVPNWEFKVKQREKRSTKIQRYYKILNPFSVRLGDLKSLLRLYYVNMLFRYNRLPHELN